MRSVKKLLQKTMVFTLTAAMLVGTPLTASAAPLNSVFSVSNGTDETASGTGTVTNTDTGSGVLNDNDLIIKGITLDRENIEAVVWNEETLKAEILFDGELKPGTDGKDVNDEDSAAVLKKLQSKIRWQVLNADKKWDPKAAEALRIGVSAGDRTVAKLIPKQGTTKELYVRASINNSQYVHINESGEKELLEYENKENATVYEAFAKVTIKEYSTKLEFAWDKDKSDPDYQDEPKVYEKHTIDLNKYLVRTSKTSNDTLTWTSSNSKVAAVNAAGVVSIKKAEEPFTIYVSGEKETAVTQWVVTKEKNEKGVQASKIEFVDESGEKITKIKPDVDLGGTTPEDAAWRETGKEITVKAYAKVNVLVASGNAKEPLTEAPASPNGSNGKYLSKKMEIAEGTEYIGVKKDGTLENDGKKQPLKITDDIAYTSKKPAIVNVKAFETREVDGKNVRTVTLVAPGTIGTANIKATASSGKNASLQVKVKATLTELTIGGELKDGDTVYTGQTFQLEAVRNPKGNKEAVKWTVEKIGNTKNKNATINSKGLLTISDQKMSDQDTVTITLATKAKKKDGTPVMEHSITLHVKQSSINGFTVKASDSNDPIVKVTAKPKTKSGITVARTPNKPKDALAIPKNVTYTAVVDGGTVDGVSAEDLASTLNWKTNKPKIVAISKNRGGQTTLTAKGIGKAKITVSGVCLDAKGKAKPVTATIEVTVKQPVTSITMKQTEIYIAEKLKNKKPKNLSIKPEAVLGPKKYDKSSDKILTWTREKWENGTWGSAEIIKDSHEKNITKAKPSISLPTPVAGDKFRITVQTEKGLKATTTVYVVKKTSKVAIAKGLKEDGTPDYFRGGKKNSKNTCDLKLRQTLNLNAYVEVDSKWKEAGTEEYEDVTYSVDKKGKKVVVVDKDGKVYAVGVGKAKITAQTPNKKKATLTINVTLPDTE